MLVSYAVSQLIMEIQTYTQSACCRYVSHSYSAVWSVTTIGAYKLKDDYNHVMTWLRKKLFTIISATSGSLRTEAVSQRALGLDAELIRKWQKHLKIFVIFLNLAVKVCTV